MMSPTAHRTISACCGLMIALRSSGFAADGTNKMSDLRDRSHFEPSSAHSGCPVRRQSARNSATSISLCELSSGTTICAATRLGGRVVRSACTSVSSNASDAVVDAYTAERPGAFHRPPYSFAPSPLRRSVRVAYLRFTKRQRITNRRRARDGTGPARLHVHRSRCRAFVVVCCRALHD
jgi:hypothetical protein